MKTKILIIIAATAICWSCKNVQQKDSVPTANPNIIFVMVDDLGYGDLGCYGQTEIKTPHIDKIAKEGIKFTNFYSGSPVCAPSRNVLMTGQHTGHCTVRGNFGLGGVTGLAGGEGRVPLKDSDVTIAEALHNVGYITGMTGKWGIGEPGTSGLPNDQGFDEWFGYLNQRRAHDHYADYIWLNRDKYSIEENINGKKGKYTHNMFTDFAVGFIDRHANEEQPFFLYIPYLLPHDEYEIPEINSFYKDKSWTEDEKVYASMISLIDESLGKIKNALIKNNIQENTLLVFTSDNGAANRWEGRFNSSASLKGRKRDVYEGGIRVPFIVSMPGSVPENKTNQTIGYFADIYPSLMDIVSNQKVENVDGISLKEVFLKNKYLRNERVLYWEFHEEGGKQAVRLGRWKGVRLDVHKLGFHDNIELYDLKTDSMELYNMAIQKPEIIKRIKEIMLKEHVVSEQFPFDIELKKE